MWAIVCFDLPVGTKVERRSATRFRNFLLDQGFSMKQWSVYRRYFPTRDQAEATADRIGKAVPSLGHVSIMFITDKQFGMTRNYDGAFRENEEKKPDQLLLL
jgi:CRISPR-associated protein Cas2